jgi:hypothetical protein
VHGAFDTTLDGYSDVVVGAPSMSTAYVFVGSASSLPSTPSFTLNAGAVAGYGTFVSSAWDVDYEGHDEIYVSTGNGPVYEYLGNASGPGTRGGFNLVLNPPSGATGFGISVADGMVNGDHFGDLLIGASASDRAFFYLGSNGAIVDTALTTTLNGAAGSHFGAAVARLER